MWKTGRSHRSVRMRKYALIGAGAVFVLAAGILAVHEIRSSHLQANLFSRLGQDAKFWVEPGASPSVRFTRTGPYDHRLGYAELPGFLERLRERNYAVTEQARVSPAFASAMDWGLFAPYREKTQAGLTVLDCRGEPLFAARYPERTYPTFETIPRVLVDTLLFIENRELFDAHPTRNPAVEWDRFAKAMLDQAIHLVDDDHDRPGGSTLATQIEKYRHSPEGRTVSGSEKLRQMASASLRSYLDGPDTFLARRRIVLDYMNSVPLAARPGYGEVNGLPDGLRVWFGRDFREVTALLAHGDSAPLAARALAYKQALALLIAQRRPSDLLLQSPESLENQANRHLRLLAEAGIITPAMRDAALAQPLALQRADSFAPPPSFAARKAANAVRASLGAMLGRPRLYELDRLDLTAATTLDARLQQAITAVLSGLQEPRNARNAGLTGPKMLEASDPAKVVYSFTLYERTPTANVVRVQADNLDQPLDINESTKLDLGSTAKLRTLITYLEIVADLHARYGEMGPAQLRELSVPSRDAIARWAIDYLAKAREGGGEAALEPMLAAALERRYSASPGETFLTGGGLHTFENFDPLDNARVLTVREGLRRSVNLVFVRLMRDIVHHFESELQRGSAPPSADGDEAVRRAYLGRFADREGSEFLRQFYRKHQGRTMQESLDQAARQAGATPKRLAVLFRSVVPQAEAPALAAFLKKHLPAAQVSAELAAKLHRDYAPERYSLADRGYLAHVHPLELFVLGFLWQHPQATLHEVLEASREERQAAYAWLAKPQMKQAQDSRIRVLIEADAFGEIHRRWKRLGYPFESLVPSYATALGSSADRPAALAELMGIVLNDGVRLPTARIEALQFAAATPYETRLEHRPGAAERVLPPEVARVVRRSLAEVVEEGTARRLKGVFRGADGKPLEVGGKTGTGDHRYETFGRGGHLISSQVVGRSGTFVFYLGDRYFGALTAHVRGPAAAEYKFTSGLPVQILKNLAPHLAALVAADPGTDPGACSRPGPRMLMARAPEGPR